MHSLKWTLLVLFTFVIQSAQAQFKEGEILAGASLGLIPQVSGTPEVPPIGIMGEYAFTENIIGGFYAGYTSSTNSTDIFDLRWRDNLIIVGVRGSYNIEVAKNLDVYGGAFVGYTIASSVLLEGEWPLNTSLLGLNVGQQRIAAFAGARYLMDNKFGLFGEVGYGISIVNVGITLNLGRSKIRF